jgi:hypothetical protein
MSTFAMRVSHSPKAQSLFGGLARVVSILRDVLDVFVEAKRQAYEAERRYPFMSS